MLMAQLIQQVDAFSKHYGTHHERTLSTIFQLAELYIHHYRLDALDHMLQGVADVCKKFGDGSAWYMKYIQMLGFCRYKQYRFREALALFLEQEQLVGGLNEILCENIGHTYSSLGEVENAKAYFNKGLKLLENGGLPERRRAGFYYGLALATNRLGNPTEALKLLHKALEGYQGDESQQDLSVEAKVKSSIGLVLEKVGKIDEAVRYAKEALQIFRETVGNRNPLTHSAAATLGEIFHI